MYSWKWRIRFPPQAQYFCLNFCCFQNTKFYHSILSCFRYKKRSEIRKIVLESRFLSPYIIWKLFIFLDKNHDTIRKFLINKIEKIQGSIVRWMLCILQCIIHLIVHPFGIYYLLFWSYSCGLEHKVSDCGE